MAGEHSWMESVGGDRVRAHTSPRVNDRIDASLGASVGDLASRPPEALGRRLSDLDHEWDVDRALMANFALAGGLVYWLGHGRGRRSSNGWRYFFRAQLAFLLMHAVVGWCPPLPAFRRLGFRTAREIGAERHAVLNELDRRRTQTMAH